ncbi:MAG: hypothetical protein A3A80_01630 [Candidatus Terrybacteria bacterium RIFCSPLOWO2_01_FULL_44_24]|uniref:Uncharacterized protein n=1 Tax=Candidatus Terrybacteria bacterium RIFCSPHIGHO2_01_FULL_43_35 TaxID=1802361 RepID=A0A1G2PHL1_9BACT|nr:MAG: hypothetical protein A2828_04005 [Candidatus Terrybacteria bacterium RIFCSPHIGHO2_01_FULL_43_35]OHA49903.1 MAG: hypothetical protein A3B75_03295 [Candidatus Terrybacteria bacterium RIFCSPHIGHO2_02_FULL_43_14]OHA51776.1 MAG: hypothetical protein A3A80_01630 [Candidatus Terrybacteria bacterium RIFCSPLOWO2_01_FULL_44_24]
MFKATQLEGSDHESWSGCVKVGATPSLPSRFTHMRIFGAIGLGLTIVVLETLVPKIFAALEETLLKFFVLAQMVIDNVQASLMRGGL